VTSSLLGRVVEGTPEDFAHPGDDYLATRAKMAPLHGHPLAGDTRFHTEEIRGIRVGRLSRPSSDPSRGTVLFFHGGAFVSCDLEAYQFYAEFVADQLGMPVVTVDYRLAPEHRFPAALEDGMAAYRALLDEGWPPDRLLLLGDSCGGGLALSTVIAARDGGRPLPAGVVALSGWVDLDTAGYAPGRPARRDPFITEGFLRARAGDYLGPEGDPHDPRASPARAALAGLPPLLLQVGEDDLCRTDAERLVGRAQEAGVEAHLDVVAGGVHGVQGLVNLGVPEARQAWSSVRRFTDQLLGR